MGGGKGRRGRGGVLLNEMFNREIREKKFGEPQLHMITRKKIKKTKIYFRSHRIFDFLQNNNSIKI